MAKLSVYDFDRTIYAKDTGVEVLKKIPLAKSIPFLPKILKTASLYLFGRASMNEFKEAVFLPMSAYTKDEWDKFIQNFWKKQQKYIFPSVAAQIKKDKADGYIVGIVSASAEILLEPIAKELGVDFLIGTKLDMSGSRISSKIIGKNCKGAEKPHRLKSYIDEHYPGAEFAKMYSDSLNDLPLYEMAEKSFTVEKDGSIREGLPKPNKNI